MTYLGKKTDWRATRRHMYALNEADLIRYARWCLKNATSDPGCVCFDALRTAQLLINEAMALEPVVASEAAE